MKNHGWNQTRRGLAAVIALAALTATGCATKGFVRQEVAGARTYTDTQVGAVRGDLDEVRTLAERLEKGQIEYTEVTSQTVNFDFDDYRLKPEAQSLLDQMASQFTQHPRYVIEIRGYADATGTDRYNYRLGRERGDEVFRYLVTRHSVPGARIATLSFGEESPVADNESEEGRAQNRRVQVRLLQVAPGQPLAAAPIVAP